MSQIPQALRNIFGIVWIHVFEQDTADGAVFLPEDADIPLSRRPRERFVLRADGSASWFTADAGDRPSAADAQWTIEDADVRLRDDRGRPILRLSDYSDPRRVIAQLAQ